MVKERIDVLPGWAIFWQAALIPDPTMIPAEDIFLLDSAIESTAHKVSLTATIDSTPGLLFHSPEALLYNICRVAPKSAKKSVRKQATKPHKKLQRRSMTTK